VDHLFPRSRIAGLSRAQWERDTRLAAAVYQISRYSRRTLPWNELVDPATVEEAFARLRAAPGAANGTLLLSFHGAATPLAQEMFKRHCPDGAILGGERIKQDGAWALDSSGDALFAALNVLRSGGFVLMAPDGWQGQQTTQFSVLGATAPGGEGGAFLAHASRCSTAWYSFACAGQSFTPAIELGPATAPGETAAAYATRLHAFYVEKLADIFTGDPRNIELIGRWGRAFARAGVENRANSGKNTPPINRWGAARGKIQK
jgi:hypothetical protein